MANYLALKIPGNEGGTPVQVEVQAPAVVPSGGLEEGGDGASAISNGITIFLVLIAVTSLFFLLFGGIKWITSQGDKTKLDSARKTIIYAIVGLILSFLSFFIINMISGFFGLSFF